MPVALLILEISIEHAQSLKDRRQVVRSLKDKLCHGFNVSVAEMDETPAWNRAVLAVAAVHLSRDYLAGQLAQVESAAERILAPLGGLLLDTSTEMMD